MTLQVPPGYSQVSFIHSIQSLTGSKPVWSIGISGAPTEPFLDDFQAWWESDMQPLMTGGMVLERIEMRNSVYSLQREVELFGGGTGDYISPQVTPLIQKRTGFAGRANRGRLYWPAVLRETDVSAEGSLTPARVASLQGTADSLMALATSTGTELVLFHNGSSDPTIITELKVMLQTATQRRRNRK